MKSLSYLILKMLLMVVFVMSPAFAGGIDKKGNLPVENSLIISLDGPDGRLQCIELTKLDHSGWLGVSAFAPGQKAKINHILIKPGQNVLNLTDQTQGKGLLSIEVIPKDAQIKLNGKVIEDQANGLFLPIGSHQVSFSREGYQATARDVGVSLCKATALRVEMVRIQPVSAQKTTPSPVAEVSKTEAVLPPVQEQSAPVVIKKTYLPGETFKDCSSCPEMIVVKSGSFTMGVPDGGFSKDAFATPVTISKPFAVSMFEITFDQWDACTREGGCKGYSPDDNGWGREGRPVIHVSWNDAQSYLDWASRKTGESYRLLSEAEWEYGARAGSSTNYSWGDQIGSGLANCANCGSKYDALKTAPVGTFKANDFGLFDTTGNVWDWVADCYAPNSYKNHKTYPKPFESSRGCNRVLRGGAWDLIGQGATTSFRFNADDDLRSNAIGFRVARDLQE